MPEVPAKLSYVYAWAAPEDGVVETGVPSNGVGVITGGAESAWGRLSKGVARGGASRRGLFLASREAAEVPREEDRGAVLK